MNGNVKHEETLARLYEFDRRDREAKICYNCKHYMQHYVLCTEGGQKVFWETYQGHCCKPRLKNRLPWDVCEKFEAGEREEIETGLFRGGR